jgi:hypothetical protein
MVWVLVQKGIHGIEDPEIKPQTTAIWFRQRWQKHMLEKRQPLQQMMLENWISTCRKLKLDPLHRPSTQSIQNWPKTLM